MDAIFGTGLDRDVEGRQRRAIEAVNSAGGAVVALDIPSGLHANTGAVLGVAVDADVTVTFAHPKLGLLSSVGAAHAGEVHVVDIGVPAELADHLGHSAEIVEPQDVASVLAPRPLHAHKVSVGHVFAVAGSAGKTGAALLVARGALRAGAGLATICTFPDAADAIDQRALEEMTARIEPGALEGSLDGALARAAAVAIGPGLGLDERARRVVDHVVLGWDGPKVVDADAISHFAGRASELRGAKGELVLTPHPGELGRLLGIDSGEVEADRFGAVDRAVELTGAVVLLKGPRTIIGAPGQLPVVNVSGTPALATGGAGDVLSGIIAALACTVEPRWAAIAGAYLHGAAAEAWTERVGADRGLVAQRSGGRHPFGAGSARSRLRMTTSAPMYAYESVAAAQLPDATIGQCVERYCSSSRCPPPAVRWTGRARWTKAPPGTGGQTTGGVGGVGGVAGGSSGGTGGSSGGTGGTSGVDSGIGGATVDDAGSDAPPPVDAAPDVVTGPCTTPAGACVSSVPSGWELVGFAVNAGSACPAGFSQVNRKANPTLAAGACDCTCTITTQPCVNGTSQTSYSYSSASCGTSGFQPDHFRTGLHSAGVQRQPRQLLQRYGAPGGRRLHRHAPRPIRPRSPPRRARYARLPPPAPRKCAVASIPAPSAPASRPPGTWRAPQGRS